MESKTRPLLSLLALLISAALVVSALGLRSRSGNSTSGLVVVCTSETSKICEAAKSQFGKKIMVAIEDPATTISRLANGEDIEAWIAPSPFPAVLTATPTSRTSFVTRQVGSSVVGLAIARDRASTLKKPPSTLGWDSLLEILPNQWSTAGGQQSWGSPKLGLDDPSKNAIGATIIAQAVAFTMTHQDPPVLTASLSSTDLGSPAATATIRTLSNSRPSRAKTADSVWQQALAQGPAAYDIVGVTDEQFRMATGARATQFEFVALEPEARVELYVVFRDGKAKSLTSWLGGSGKTAIQQAGFDPNSATAHDEIPDLFVEAIRQRFGIIG